MVDEKKLKTISETQSQREKFDKDLAHKIARKLKARKYNHHDALFGLSFIGLVGWSIVTPMLLGAMLGIWIDKKYASTHSWTLTLLLLGLVIGCANVWRWIDQQNRDIQGEEKQP